MTIAHHSRELISSIEKLDLTSSTTDLPVTPTSCVELLKEVAEGAVAGLLDDDDSSFNSQQGQTLLDTPPNSQTSAFLAGWLGATQSSSEITPPRLGSSVFGAGTIARSIPHPLDYSTDLASFFNSGNTHSNSSPASQTSVMLRNIPNKYTRTGLLGALAEHGFDASKHCNNLYLPMDAGSGCNLGYAFLNFHTHEEATEFMKRFDGCRLPSAGSRKVCSVVWANRQGIFQHSNPPVRLDESPTSASNSAVSGFSNNQTNGGNSTNMLAGAAAAAVSSAGMLAAANAGLNDRAAIAELFSGSTNCYKVFVGGLSATTTEADLVNYFSLFGPVKECCIVSNRQTGTSRGFGFCEFIGPESVQRVHLAQLRKPHCINGRVVSVRLYNFQHSNPLSAMGFPPPPPSDYMGGVQPTYYSSWTGGVVPSDMSAPTLASMQYF